MEVLQRTANRGSVSTGYDIDYSCKFEADNSEYLSRTPSSAGNRKTWTFSCWLKRTEITSDSNSAGNQHMIFSAGDTWMQFDGNAIWTNHRAASENFFLATNRLFRDTSAWYHLVWQCDTTQGTASNRAKLYVNGVQETSFQNSTYDNLSQNYDTAMNNTVEHEVGKYSLHDTTYANPFCGYMAEIHLVDGTALDATSFGEFDDDSGIWKPKAYTGSYGTNGFYLDFADAADLGDDESGNGNDYTETNLAAADQSTDTPTNNFCTFNVLQRNTTSGTNPTFTEGATVVNRSTGAGWMTYLTTMAANKGKWYAEFELERNEALQMQGTQPVAYTNAVSTTEWYLGSLANGNAGVGYYGSGDDVYHGGGYTNSSASTAGDIISVAMDCDNNKVHFAVNGSWTNSSDPANNTNGFAINDELTYIVLTSQPANRTYKTNFGGFTTISISSAASDADGYGTFEYAPPSGFYAMCTKNLAEYG